MQPSESDIKLVESWRNDWNKYIRDCIGARLDREQRRIVDSVNHNRRTSARSGHARGKDFTAACISLTFLTLYPPCKVINTAPTGRQAVEIEMAEISRLHRKSKMQLGGKVMSDSIRFYDPITGEAIKDHYLLAFKAGDKETESWTGFHSSHILVVVTEASGIEQETFDAIDGILTGTLSRLLIVFNPNRKIGEAYQSTRSSLYAKHKLSCLNAPNVRARKILIPGQVDYEWVKEKLDKPGWATKISSEEADRASFHDFIFDGQWYRPSDLFLVKVLGEFPRASEDQLIPMEWVESANERWASGEAVGQLRLGCDICGQGRDTTVYAPRFGNYVGRLEVYADGDHMVNAGRIKNKIHDKDALAFVDTIGEGAGVHSRLAELGEKSVSAKFSFSAEEYRDLTGEREFANMRAYCYWAIRDALDPAHGVNLALPPDDELLQELTEHKWKVQSNGKIIIEPKEDIKKRIGRSPDKADAVALSYFPDAIQPQIRFV